MKTANTFGVLYILRTNKKLQEDQFPIYIKITVNGTHTELSTKIYISKKNWNGGKGFSNPKTQELVSNYHLLGQMREKIKTTFLKMELNGEKLTAQTVKQKYFDNDPDKTRSLNWLINEHNIVMKNTLAVGTLKNYFITQGYLARYLKLKYGGDIQLHLLKYEFIESFKNYILKNPIKDHDPCSNNGVMKHLERLKKILKWAHKNEWIEHEPFKNYPLKLNSTDIQFLNTEELLKLNELSNCEENIALIKDLFLFSCFTGMSYSDMMDAGAYQIKKDEVGRIWLYTKRKKSKVKADIPVLPITEKLINKYSKDIRSMQRGTFFPHVSNQTINKGLKIISEKLNLSFKLNHHIARHTFATILIRHNVPITTVQKIMGHKKITTTMRYVHLLNDKVGLDMDEFWSKLNMKF